MRPRTTILLGVIILLGAAVFLILSSQQAPPAPTPSAETAIPTPAIPTVQIVVAAQSIPRGRLITEDAVTLVEWPETSVPPGAFQNIDEVLNLIARTDILFNQPLTDVMLTNNREQLVQRGSDAALLIPNDRRGLAIPIDQISGVAYAVQPGDHVDILISLWLIDTDRDGQYGSPYFFNRSLSDDLIAAGMDPENAVSQAIALTTRQSNFPRLSSQIILQDIEVVSVGNWENPTPIPRFTPGIPIPEAVTPEGAPPSLSGTPTVTPPRPDVVILSVTPQQALLLQWLRESDAIIDLALRGPTDRAPVDTQAVTLQYIIDNFAVTLPPKLDFSVNYLPPSEEPGCPDRWTKDSCR
jgi:pilus assembly protein CpaB